MASLKFNIGTSKPIVLEKWQQGKNASGSTTDTLVTRITAYANIERTGGVRDYDRQIKEVNTFRVIARQRGLAVDCLWKIVYKGKRHTVLSKECIDERSFDYLLIVK